MDKKELEKILTSLSLEEKIGQTVQLTSEFFSTDFNSVQTGPAQEIGLPNDFDILNVGSVLNVTDPHEVQKLQEKYLEKSTHKIPLLFMADIIYGNKTIFPIPLAQSGSFDFDLIKAAGSEIAKETYNAGVHVTFSPMLDIVRDPRWGRVMESPGEDVYTTKQFAKNIVEGFQGQLAGGKIPENHIASCIKHFAGYGAPEAGKDYNTVDLSEVRFRQDYLPGYQAAIEANAKLVMTAFNTLEGVPCTGNEWLNSKVLREENNFQGVLITDHSAITEMISHGFAENQTDAAEKAIKASVDIDMMTSSYANELKGLIEGGKLTEQLLDEAVFRILALKNDLGLFENPYRGLKMETTGEFLADSTKSLAKELVKKSCVLLKNENSILPLNTDGKVALVGPFGDTKLTLGFWAFTGSKSDVVTLKEGIEKYLNSNQLKVSVGTNMFEGFQFPDEFSGDLFKNAFLGDQYSQPGNIEDAKEIASNSDVIIYAFGENLLETGEGASKTILSIPEGQKALLKELKKIGKPIVGVLYTGRPLVLSDVEEYFDAILLAWFPGTMGGDGIADLLFGETSPSGKLSMTFPRNEGQIPIHYGTLNTGRPLNEKNSNGRFISRYLDSPSTPLYPFGYGLSYCDFQYENGRVTGEVLTEDEVINLSIEVKNLSGFEGDEVVQLYIRDFTADIVRPVKELVATKRISLRPKETLIVEFEVTSKLLSYISKGGELKLEPGKIALMVGRSSAEIVFEKNIEFQN